MARKQVSKDNQKEVLIKSRRRCAICFYLNTDLEVKKGQIAHLDRNSSNTDSDNLCYLCLEHHDEYDSRTSQRKGFAEEEVRHYRSELYSFYKDQDFPIWTDSFSKDENVPDNSRPRLSIEVYDRKIKIYRTVRDFIVYLTTEAKIDKAELFKFAKDTEEVIFLFNEEVSEYLVELFKKAVKFRFVNIRLDGTTQVAEKKRLRLVQEDIDLLNWFMEQETYVKKLFAKFIYLE